MGGLPRALRLRRTPPSNALSGAFTLSKQYVCAVQFLVLYLVGAPARKSGWKHIFFFVFSTVSTLAGAHMPQGGRWADLALKFTDTHNSGGTKATEQAAAAAARIHSGVLRAVAGDQAMYAAAARLVEARTAQRRNGSWPCSSLV